MAEIPLNDLTAEQIDQDAMTALVKKALNAKFGTNFEFTGEVTPELTEEINKHEELRDPTIPPPDATRTEAAIPCPEQPPEQLVNRAAGALSKDCNATYDHYSIPGKQADQGPDFSVNHNVKEAAYEYNYCLEHGTKPVFAPRQAVDTGPTGAAPTTPTSPTATVPYVKPSNTNLCKGGGFPKQREVERVYGPMGQNQASLPSPYTLYVYGQQTNVIRAHEMVVESAQRVLTRALDHYGAAQIHALKLDIYGGALCVRKMKGGNSWSMHSWGIAMDWHPEANGFKVNHTQALFAQPIYVKWWELWEEECWVSLGRARDFDWMHIQAARF